MGENALACRLEITERDSAKAASRLAAQAAALLGPQAQGVTAILATNLYLLNRHASTDEQLQLSSALIDNTIQQGRWVAQQTTATRATGHFAEIALRAGVTDPTGEAFGRAAALLGIADLQVRSGIRFDFPAGVPADVVRLITETLLHNEVVDEVAYDQDIVPRFIDAERNELIETIPLRTLADDELTTLSQARRLSLDPEELLVIRDYFRSIDRDPTDAELETIAQTWSEHCSHKTFRANITWDNGDEIVPLLKQLRNSTDSLAMPWVKSAFVDNAGIIAFDDKFDLAIKVETHNHPSAIEPFGGANTGVGGVIRDVLGVAADPIAVTDILCFGPLDTRADDVPAGSLHPQRVRDGVIAGIADYGNKLGLPTVAGAIAHQEGFTANPLVFAGCIGLRPANLVLSGQQPGQRIIAIGGATGRDGIRGATFSSETMDATTGDVAGASVQIGDPIIEKLVADVLTEARNALLFTAITDCGAGGFSSAIGEIAAELGAEINLDLAPRKYPGLAPWEVWLSEAQERMVLAVKTEHVSALSSLCEAYGVGMADLGCFRSDGRLLVVSNGATVVDLPSTFLHDGRPTRRLTAVRPIAPRSAHQRDAALVIDKANDLLMQILAHSDVRSNEDVVRGYDHEILGATIGRPYQGARDDGPSDAAVLAPLTTSSGRGFAIGIGMNVRTGVFDARRMAEASVDEAIRNVVAVGADPDHIALLDNFSWGNPRRPETLGQLVDAVEGCVNAAHAHRAPFVSGKDSLNNEYETPDGQRRSIPPTLVITALAVLPDASNMVTSDVKRAGNRLVLVGETQPELRGSVLDAVLGIDGGGDVPGGDPDAPARYRAVHAAVREGFVASAHDVSDGGLATALAEMSLGGRLGLDIDLTRNGVPASSKDDLMNTLFSETAGRIVLECLPDNVASLCERLGGIEIGSVVGTGRLTVRSGPVPVINLSLDELLRAWRGHVSTGFTS